MDLVFFFFFLSEISKCTLQIWYGISYNTRSRESGWFSSKGILEIGLVWRKEMWEMGFLSLPAGKVET